MPQLFQVLKCFKCLVFQVHQTKKSNKWQCKLCGEKQSIKRHYGLGSGKECRIHVQKLNGIRGENEELSEFILLNKSSDEESKEREPELIIQPILNRKSKWSNFTDETEVNQESNINESMYLGNAEVVLDIPIRKRKKFEPPNAKAEPTPPPTTTTYCLPVFETNESMNQDNVLEFDMSRPFFKSTSRLKPNHSNTLPRINTITEKKHCSISNETKFHDFNEVGIENNNKKLFTPDIKKKETYIPPKVDNSKWAQFVEEPDENTIISIENSYENILASKENAGNNLCDENKPNSSENVNQLLFSLCDDEELDEVLGF